MRRTRLAADYFPDASDGFAPARLRHNRHHHRLHLPGGSDIAQPLFHWNRQQRSGCVPRVVSGNRQRQPAMGKRQDAASDNGLR